MPRKSKSSSKVKKAEANYERAVKTSKPGEGKRFKAGAKVLEAKGMSEESANRIMASRRRKKYGKAKMAEWSAKGRKK